VKGTGLRGALLIALRDVKRFWQYKFWLGAQIAMNLADILIFAVIFNNIVNRQYIPDYVKFLATGILALSTFASAFSIGREVGIEIRREFTHYLLSLPLSRTALVLGRILSGTLRGLIYQSSFIVLAMLVVGAPSPAGLLLILATSTMLSASMSSLAIAISTSTRDFNLQATFRSLTYYVLFFLSNVFYPEEVLRQRFPPLLVCFIKLSPVSLASDIYRYEFHYYAGIDVHFEALALTAWALTTLALASLLYMRNLTRV
jgi:ABC-2 type transport system permease protein